MFLLPLDLHELSLVRERGRLPADADGGALLDLDGHAADSAESSIGRVVRMDHHGLGGRGQTSERMILHDGLVHDHLNILDLVLLANVREQLGGGELDVLLLERVRFAVLRVEAAVVDDVLNHFVSQQGKHLVYLVNLSINLPLVYYFSRAAHLGA